MVELHVFPHTAGPVQAGELKVSAGGVAAAVVPHPSAHVQGRHAALRHLAVLRLHCGEVVSHTGPLVLVLLHLLLLLFQEVEISLDRSLLVGLVSRQGPCGLPGFVRVVFLVSWCGQGVRAFTVRVKQCAKDETRLSVLLTLRSSHHLPLPPPPLGGLLPLPRLDGVLPHLHRPAGVVQLLVQPAGVTDGGALRVPRAPPQGRLVGLAVEARGVRTQPQVFLLMSENIILYQKYFIPFFAVYFCCLNVKTCSGVLAYLQSSSLWLW